MTVPETGTPAPPLELSSHQGGRVSLADLRGTTVVVSFFPLAFTPV